VEGVPLAVISLHGRYADIVVVGQKDPGGEEGVYNRGLPDELILSLGRPVLVIPHSGEFPAIGERIIVAWDASRLAARAVNDALAFLEVAKEVTVLAVNPKTGEGERGHGDIPSADICLHLARHGVRAEAQQMQAEELGVGQVLLSRAIDKGADLMVCGAYGHARWREIVLGGVTRHLLAHMTIPVLMSH
jgi:nucleotide-binding universal stress UspA family protein